MQLHRYYNSENASQITKNQISIFKKQILELFSSYRSFLWLSIFYSTVLLRWCYSRYSAALPVEYL